MIRFGELNTFTTCGSKLSRLSTLNSGSNAGASQASTSFSAKPNHGSLRNCSRMSVGLPR